MLELGVAIGMLRALDRLDGRLHRLVTDPNAATLEQLLVLRKKADALWGDEDASMESKTDEESSS